MTRIVAGRFGGRRLTVPAAGTRPTSDRAREGIFSTLDSILGGFEGVRFLDLYAGSGAVGVEAWSRGAARVVLVESAPRAVDVARANVAALSAAAGPAEGAGRPDAGPAGEVAVVAATVESAARGLPASGFDVVFADPPYDLPSAALASVIETLLGRGVIVEGSIVVVERAARDPWAWPAGVTPLRDRRYGDAVVWYGRAARQDVG